MTTFSPELKLHLGRVQSRDAAEIRLEQLRRPDLAAGMDEEEGVNGVEEESPVIIQMSEIDSAAQSKYRIVSASS